MKNVVGYIRVSTDAQAGEDRFGITAQKEQILAYCQSHDMNLIEWFIDEGESGVKDNRPQLNRILFEDIENPPVEAVVVAKNDRIARDIKLYFYYKQLLAKKCIDLISVSEDFGELGAFSAILEAFAMFVAEQERNNITRRTSGGRAVKAAKGGYAGGRPPYGYRAEGGKLVIDEAEAEVVRLIFLLRKDGATYQDIVNRLSDNGARTRKGNVFAISTVQTVLNNEKLYQGYYKYGKSDEWVAGQHDAILEV